MDPNRLKRVRCACQKCGAHVVVHAGFALGGNCGNCGSYDLVRVGAEPSLPFDVVRPGSRELRPIALPRARTREDRESAAQSGSAG